MGQRDVARRAAGEAEEDQHDRAVRGEAVERQLRAIDLLESERFDVISLLDEARPVGALLESFALTDVGLQIATGRELGRTGVQYDGAL